MKVNELGELLVDYFATSAQISWVFSPFVTPGALERILAPRVGGAVTLVTSWQLENLVSGVASLEVYQICKANGWTLYIRDDLHAKFYSQDLRRAWVGSANLTGKGLGLVVEGNRELLTHIEALSSEDRVWAFEIRAGARRVDDALFEAYSTWLDSQDVTVPPRLVGSPRNRIPEIEGRFLTSQLPASTSPGRLWEIMTGVAEEVSGNELAAAEHDTGVFGVAPAADFEGFRIGLRKSVFQQPFMAALAAAIPKGGLRFGGVKEWVQRHCEDDPVPYRWELTPHVQSILAWLVQLAPDRFEIVRPRHSQVIRPVPSL